jgi:CubicO group peptidase (beta-lactamase class C family)
MRMPSVLTPIRPDSKNERSFYSAPMTQALSVAVALASAVTVHAQTTDVTSVLETIREKRQLPALAAAVMKDGKLVAIGATGLRRLGGTERVTIEDKWHVGSCTKSMTASVAARLVERGVLKWDQMVGETLASRCPGMDAAWKPVTLEQLFGHRAGAPPEAPKDLLAEAWQLRGSPSAQRWNFTRGLLKAAPAITPGTKFAYSNQGYVIAGQMMELAAKKPWESLMRELLFEPLQLRSAGFGAAGNGTKADQPWGHKNDVPVPPGPHADNPPAIGPAGTVHLSIGDFARYGAWHARGKEFLKPEQFTKLHTPLEGQDYALGWGVTERPWGKGKVLTHTGSNTMNFAVIWVAPARDFTVVAATNSASEEAGPACDDACAQLIQRILSPQ